LEIFFTRRKSLIVTCTEAACVLLAVYLYRFTASSFTNESALTHARPSGRMTFFLPLARTHEDNLSPRCLHFHKPTLTRDLVSRSSPEDLSDSYVARSVNVRLDNSPVTRSLAGELTRHMPRPDHDQVKQVASYRPRYLAAGGEEERRRTGLARRPRQALAAFLRPAILPLLYLVSSHL